MMHRRPLTLGQFARQSVARAVTRVTDPVVSLASRAKKWGSKQLRDPLIASWWGLEDDDTGLSITAESSMQVAAVSAAVRLLAEVIASMPLMLYERTTVGKELADGHPLWDIIHRKPNNSQTPYEFKEMMMGHILLRGNAYGEIISSGGASVSQVIPRHPDRIRPFWTKDGQRAYEYYQPDGGTRIILASEMLHVMFFSMDGLMGLDPIAYHRRTIGLTMGAEKYGGRFYKNDARPAVMLMHPGQLTDDGRQNLKESWNKQFQGVGNAHRTAVLEEGMKVEQMSVTPENAQFLETRKFQVSDIARIFRVPPHMIGDLERATFSNIEQQSLEFVIYNLTPWLVKWEQAITRDLLSETDSLRFFAEFKVDALLRGDIRSRYAAYAVARQWGWLSVNEIRKFENLNPIENGDIYLQPMNMVPAEQMRELSPKEAKATRLLAMRSMFEQLPREQVMEIFQEEPNA